MVVDEEDEEPAEDTAGQKRKVCTKLARVSDHHSLSLARSRFQILKTRFEDQEE